MTKEFSNFFQNIFYHKNYRAMSVCGYYVKYVRARARGNAKASRFLTDV